MPPTRRPTRYIESFDTVRFAPAKDSAERYIQAELELMIGLLFGEPMVVHGSMSFDSRAFLQIASKVLSRRPERTRLSPVRHPFELALQPNPNITTYAELLGRRFSQTHKDFILSGWPGLSDDPDGRKLLAEGARAGNFGAASKAKPEIRKQIEQLDELSRYFKANPPCAAGNASKSLEDHVRSLAGEGRNLIPVDSPQRIQSLPDKLQGVIESKCVKFENRTDIRIQGPRHFDHEELQFLIEFVDSSYNRVIAESVGATVCVFSTGADGNDPDVQWGEFLAEQINTAIVEQAEIQTPYTVKIDTKRMKLGGLERAAFDPAVWDDIWDILIDDDWIRSVQALHAAQTRDQVNEQIDRHIRFLANAISTIKFDHGDRRKKLAPPLAAAGIGGAVGAAGQVVGGLVEMKFAIPGVTLIAAGAGAAAGTLITTVAPAIRGFIARGSIERALRADVLIQHRAITPLANAR